MSARRSSRTHALAPSPNAHAFYDTKHERAAIGKAAIGCCTANGGTLERCVRRQLIAHPKLTPRIPGMQYILCTRDTTDIDSRNDDSLHSFRQASTRFITYAMHHYNCVMCSAQRLQA